MAADEVQLLDLKDLDVVLQRAKAEGWTKLALLGLWRPRALAQELAIKLIREGWSADRVFLFNEELDRMPPTLACLTGLTSLDLANNRIGVEGAKAIASLTGLTALDLADNQIGDEGAKAIANLSGLTTLDLNHNRIGDAGRPISEHCSLDCWDCKWSDRGKMRYA